MICCEWVKKALEKEYITQFIDMQKLITNIRKIVMIKIMNLDVNNLYSWAMLRKLPVNKFKCVEDTLQFNDDFIKNR